MSGEIIELTTEEQWIEAYSIMKQLRSDLTEESYLELLNDMQKDEYTMFGLYTEGNLVSLAGFSWRVNFYNKRHIFLYDLITDGAHRSHGYGEKLLRFIQDWAKENGADYVALESGVQRLGAHRFYEEKLGYEKWCYSFRKAL